VGVTEVRVTNEQLVAEYAATRSPRVLDELVRRNQRLLHHLLKRFAYAQEPYEDLLQVANLGLLKAVQRFDPAKGRTFSTYAAALIEGEIRHHLRDSLLLRQPRWVRKVYGQISEAQTELTRTLQRTPTLRELSERLNITEQGIIEVLQLYTRVDVPGEPLSGEEYRAGAERAAVHSLRLQSFTLPVEDRITLYDALDKLSGVERKIIYLLFFREFTQHEVAAALGLTQKKVSRESIKALARLKSVLTRNVI
jgi:RNA polymerase sigma-B factor